jgi:hypothetical protein
MPGRPQQPPMTPQRKRDVLVASYLDSYRRAGIKRTVEEVTNEVIADCELVDAADRAGELRGGGTKDPTPARERPDPIQEAAQQNGVRLLAKGETSPTIWRPGFLFRNPQQVSERWGYAVGRIARIIEGGTKDGALAALSRAYKTLFACFQLRNVPAANRGFRVNQFDGLTDRDAARAFMRGVEDICDKSTGLLGSWYVK